VSRVLDALRPAPLIQRKGETDIFGQSRKYNRWRIELGRRSASGEGAFRSIARWARANSAVIRAARRAGLRSEAQIEIYVRHVRYELPMPVADVQAIQDVGLVIHVVYCATGVE